MQHPVGVQVVYSVQDLVKQGLDHGLGHLHRGLLPGLDGPVVLDDVLGEGQAVNPALTVKRTPDYDNWWALKTCADCAAV